MAVSAKICGLTSEDAVKAVIAAKADYAGFVYFPTSPRHIPLQRAAELKALLPPQIRSVSVLVDPDDALLEQVQSQLNPAYVQLHGKESPERLRGIRMAFPKLKLIKAIRVRSSDDVAQANGFIDIADMLMFDAKPPEMPGILPGGNGLAFDWALLKHRSFILPWFLSGGLNADNVAEAIRQTGARMVDVSSGVESSPGVKDPALIQAFIEAVRNV
jgi:phosphoribosylanthranilate isomerase